MKKQKLLLLLLGTVMALTFASCCTDDPALPEPTPEPVYEPLKIVGTKWSHRFDITVNGDHWVYDDIILFETDSTGIRSAHFLDESNYTYKNHFQYTYEDPNGFMAITDPGDEMETVFTYDAEENTLTTLINNEVFHRVK